MFTITTAEIRWFLPGHPDENLATWLRGLGGTFEEQEPRNDLYLLFQGQEALGIKLREGRLEFKKRLGVHPLYEGASLSGKPETWVKWSIQAGEKVTGSDDLLTGSGHWISIRKSRFIQKYMIRPEGSLAKPPADGYPERGIMAELSGLSVKGTDWWTFGLECFGPEPEVCSLLLAGIGQLIPGIPYSSFHPSNCMGYPEWINRMVP